VDEVLAVGDAEFQKKALGKMRQVSEGEGRTVLFVSHSMPAIKKLCTSGMILGMGRVEYIGDTSNAVEKYLNLDYEQGDEFQAVLSGEQIKRHVDGSLDKTHPFLTFRQISVMNESNEPATSFSSRDEIRIQFEFDINFVAPDFRIVLSIVDGDNTSILNSQLTDADVHDHTLKPGSYIATCYFPRDTFASNVYVITVHLINVKKEHYVYNGLLRFRVKYENPRYIYAPFDQTYFRPNLKWDLKTQRSYEK
jgi:lipopolysaccharide transport system ATP-binding protein